MSKASLSPLEITKIQQLANKQRNDDKLNGNSVGSKIFAILQNKGINVLLFSLSNKVKNSLLGLYIRKPNSVMNKSSHYIAINTSVPYDDMIFNLCHEYYHFLTDDVDQVLITRSRVEDNINEVKANRFAAEYLLPKHDFELFIQSENDGVLDLNDYPTNSIYRLISMSVLKYRVAYQVVVKRLVEINSINEEYAKKLLILRERDSSSMYYNIGVTLGGDEFKYLNRSCEESNTSVVTSKGNTIVSDIFHNYDKGRIPLETLRKDLAIFGIDMKSFGYEDEEPVFDKDLMEMFEDNEGTDT
jgi:Zn-dependent peptidase ImmA (M78 family)